jgi:hypothetical protein
MFAENWCIKANDRVYGPYTSEQLRKFAHEGRFAAYTMIAPAGSRDWREARNEAAFSAFFGADMAPVRPSKTFGHLDRSASDHAIAEPANSDDAARSPRRARPLGARARTIVAAEQAGPANFVLIFDVVNAAASRVETALASLGTAFRLADNVWTVNCQLTAIGVRNAIAPYLKPYESLFVIDATNGRTSWQNYPPEAHAKITQAFVHARH